MAPKEPAAACLSTTDIESALQTLPNMGWVRLRKIADVFARRYRIEADELLHDAILRALDGCRRCPSNVDLIKFLSGVMRSIASDTLKMAKRRPELHLVSVTDGEESAYDPPDKQPNAEEALVTMQEISRIKQRIIVLFEDDPVAQIMVEGKMEGMDGEELRALTDLDMTAFASKQKLIRRRINKAFRKDGHHDQR